VYFPRIPALPVLLLLALVMGLQPAKSMATEDDTGIWAIFSTTDAFETDSGTSRWRYWFDAQARYFDVGSGINQYVLRPGIGYDVSDNMSVWAGYGYFHSRTADGTTVTEDRFWQQLSWNAARMGGGVLSMRTRLEQRSISRGDDLGIVLRYMAKYVRPIGESQGIDLILSVEPFFDLVDTDWSGDAGLAQVRAVIGVGWTLTPKFGIETGYMNQYVRRDNAENLANHLAVVNFKVKF
jgi:hypothetical protein